MDGINEYITDTLTEEMIESMFMTWMNVSMNSFVNLGANWDGDKKFNLKTQRRLLRELEIKHPRVYAKVRSN